jgi:hypothetical protein
MRKTTSRFRRGERWFNDGIDVNTIEISEKHWWSWACTSRHALRCGRGLHEHKLNGKMFEVDFCHPLSEGKTIPVSMVSKLLAVRSSVIGGIVPGF